LAADFQDQVDELIVQVEQSTGAIERLAKCKPDFATLKAHLMEVQQVVDFLDKKGYQNIGHWVAQLDAQVIYSFITLPYQIKSNHIISYH
jgi:hypothetical protein